MKALNLPLILLTLIFIAGLIMGVFVPLPLKAVILSLSFIFPVFLIIYFLQRNRPFYSYSFAAIAFILMFIIGFFATKFHSQENNKDHYINYLSSSGFHQEDGKLFLGKVVKELNSNQYSNKYVLKLSAIGKRAVEGEVLLNVGKDSTGKALKIDDVIALDGSLSIIQPPRNPYQFDYNAFMKNRGVFRQIFCQPQEVLVLRNELSFRGFAENARESIVKNLRENGFSESQLAMVQALLLGQTDDISDKIYDNYKTAGVVHILSVSGLHVGFVLLILNFMLKFLERLKHGKYIKVILLVLLMWSFALLAGFSAAVVRSVTMFSVVAVGLNFGRKTYLLNILFMSLLAILLFAPQFIFELGFQLSYLAVISIVIFQPHIYAFWKPRTKVGKLGWGTMTVSLAAQIGIFPLILYYFHQFPGMFLLSNLLIIPLVGLILGLIMASVALAFLGILPDFVAYGVGKSIDVLNMMVAWFADRREFLIENIHFTSWEMWGSYLVLFFIVLLVWKFTYQKVLTLALSTILLLGVFIAEKQHTINSSKFLVFDKSRKTILVQKFGKELNIFHNLPEENIEEEYTVKSFCAGEGIRQVSSKPLKNIYKLGSDFLLVVDSSGVYQMPEMKDCYVLLRDSPKINLERLINTLSPKKIIVDGSNYKSYVARWEKTCSRRNIAFHYTRKMGVFEKDF